MSGEYMATTKAGAGHPQNQPAQSKSDGGGPSVSVVVPAYNVEDYVVACVQSLMRQTYSDLEIVVVDDGSTDRTGQLLDGLAEIEGSRLKVVHQSNGGLSMARNNGLAASSGDFVCFVDGDDQVAPDMISVLVAALDVTGAELACCGHATYTPEGMPSWSVPPYRVRVERQPEALEETLYYRGAGTNAWAKLGPRELWMNHLFQPGLLYEDLATVPGVIADCDSIAVVDAALYGFAVRPGSITRTSRIRFDRVRDLSTAIELCGLAEPENASEALMSAFRARRATELCRVINLCDQASDDLSQVAKVRDKAEVELRRLAMRVITDSRAPIGVRMRVSLSVLVPAAYPLFWKLKKFSEGWL